jgi:Tfp pilus assembly protein PilE
MSTAKKAKDFRGLTIFELITILAIIGVVVLWALSFRGGLQNKTQDAIRRGRVSTFAQHLNVYITKNDSFPSTEDFLNNEKREDDFAEFLTEEGKDALNDPQDKNKVIDYIAEPEGCARDTETLCTRVSVGFSLSGGEDFVKFSIKPGTEAEAIQSTSEDDSTVPQSLTGEGE